MRGATILLIPEIAHQMGLIPLVWLGWLHFRKRDPGAAWWWLAGAFFVSWLADTASHWTGHLFISAVYPAMQASLVGFVFLYRRDAAVLIVTLTITAIASLVWQQYADDWPQRISSRDLLLHTVAWLSVVGFVWPLRSVGRIRLSVLAYFGLGWLAWLGYTLEPAWSTWLSYQFTRLAGFALFCWASLDTRPQFKLSSAKRKRLGQRAHV